MKGLSLEELKEVLDFMKEHHGFASYRNPEQRAERMKEFPLMGEYGMNIKYVDMCYDSRTHDVWSITFRVGMAKVNFRTNQITAITVAASNPKKLKKLGSNYKSLKDICMAWMKGEFKPPKEFFIND